MIRLLLAILLLALPCNALAELPVSLEKDFAKLSGYVVMPMGQDEFLIDLDASKGVNNGDIFSIIHKGKSITHPISGEVIGNLDGSAAFLQVTRIKSGYSYVRKIGGTSDVVKGDRIQRFESIPVRFNDKTADSDLSLKSELQSRLPQLDWLSSQSSVAPLLLFERSSNSLRVNNVDGTALFSYPMKTMAATAPVAPQPGTTTGTVPVATATVAATAAATSAIIQNQTDTSQTWHGEEHAEEVFGLLVDDFNNDGIQETAMLLQESLIISSYNGQQHTQITKLSLKKKLSFLAIDSLDMNGNGKPEIFLSAISKGVPSSSVYELDGNKLTEIAKDLPILFRRIEQPQNGALLLGQKRHDLKVPFSERPFKVVYTNGAYKQGDDYSLPETANIYGYTPLTADKGSLLYAHLNSSDYLTISSPSDGMLFESPDRFGGSENKFDLKEEAHDDLVVSYFVPLRIITANGEILVPQHEGQRMSQAFRRYTKSRIVSLKWNGLSLDENWRTSDQSGQTADFTVADIDNDGQQELVLAVKFSRKGVFSKPKSAIVVYELH